MLRAYCLLSRCSSALIISVFTSPLSSLLPIVLYPSSLFPLLLLPHPHRGTHLVNQHQLLPLHPHLRLLLLLPTFISEHVLLSFTVFEDSLDRLCSSPQSTTPTPTLILLMPLPSISSLL